jgi:hypothetical protein
VRLGATQTTTTVPATLAWTSDNWRQEEDMNTMSKKLFIGAVPLLVTAVCAFGTTVAQAAPAKWEKNFTILANGKPEPTIAWGTLELKSPAGNISCKNAAGATVENVAGGVENNGPTTAFATWECKASGQATCPLVAGTTKVKGEGLPWPGKVEEEGLGTGKYRATETSGVKVNIGCFVGPGSEPPIEAGKALFQTGEVAPGEIGTWTPAVQNGSSAGRPSEVLFGAGSGNLRAATEVEIGEGGETPFNLEKVEATKGSSVLKGKGFLKAPIVKTGFVVNGLTISTDGNQPAVKGGCRPGKKSKAAECPNVTVVIAVTETEITLGIAEYNESTEKYEFKGKLSEAVATGSFTIGFQPGTGKFVPEVFTTEILGKLKTEGYEGTPVPTFTLEP